MNLLFIGTQELIVLLPLLILFSILRITPLQIETLPFTNDHMDTRYRIG